MKQADPTPGPWRRNPRKDTLNRYHVYGPPHPVDGGYYAPICTTSNEADARLIAAAPELAAALEDAMRWIGKLTDWEGADDPDVDTWRSALAKARGQS